jgi:hypothetical protein
MSKGINDEHSQRAIVCIGARHLCRFEGSRHKLGETA